jgi:hypothetical protein
MSQNLYNQASRYLVMLDPAGFVSWLLGLHRSQFAFQGWLDTRAIAYPGESDRTSDLVAHLVNFLEHGRPWAISLEFQIVPDTEMFSRALSQIAAIWKYVRPDNERGSRFFVGAAVVNLTGRGNCSQQMHWPEAKLTTNMVAVERNLEFESADEILKGVESGLWPRSQLAFAPLMIGGGESGIIERWVALAGAEPNIKYRSDYAGLALIFADRVGRKAIWNDKLKGWNMTESAFINEFIAMGEARGRAEGEARGRIEAARSLILRFGAKRFGSPTSTIELALLAISDRERLERISDRILEAADWNDLLATP